MLKQVALPILHVCWDMPELLGNILMNIFSFFALILKNTFCVAYNIDSIFFSPVICPQPFDFFKFNVTKSAQRTHTPMNETITILLQYIHKNLADMQLEETNKHSCDHNYRKVTSESPIHFDVHFLGRWQEVEENP